MSRFRFFGTASSLPDGTALTKYGQVVEMSDELANALIAADPPALLLREILWEDAGITDAELAEFPSVKDHGRASEEFRAKTSVVRSQHHEDRKALRLALGLDPAP